MGGTVPAWMEVTAFVMGTVGMAAYVVWAVVLWVVRLRFPLADVDPRLTPRAHEDLVLQLTGPAPRVTREAVVPSAHQPAARRPEWRAPVGPWFPDGTAVRLPMTPQAGRPTRPTPPFK